ncbi:ABC transporter permease [Actinomadura soli]|uniref:ABC transporter permease n=1 Tax=Actinomadura soli TaxID=2508997 RepID=UPI00197AE532|nr:ABC transporter permease [Actinomadura soli]
MSLVVLLGLLAVAVLGPWLPLGDPAAVNVGPRLAAPSGEWWTGTDSLGRSVLPRLVEGIRTTFLLAGVAVMGTVALGVALGMLAAYYRGPIAELIIRGADVLFAFPSLLLAILLVAITGPGAPGAVISIVLICSPLMVRVVRAASLSVVGRDFVVAARVGGAGPVRILLVHVLPNVAGTAVVQATYALSVGMLIESGLSFLGLGLQPPNASLGSLVHEGAVYLPIAPWLVLIPGALLALAIMAVNLVGDGLRDALDVRGVEVRR